jgi:PPE-repeat protein
VRIHALHLPDADERSCPRGHAHDRNADSDGPRPRRHWSPQPVATTLGGIIGRCNTGRDDTGRGNTDRGNTGRDNTGRDNTGRDNTGRDNTGRDNTGRDTKQR